LYSNVDIRPNKIFPVYPIFVSR